MIFHHQSLEQELEWSETQHLAELVIEHPGFLRSVLKDFTVHDGDCRLSVTRDGKALSSEKDIDVIFNPLQLDFNNRRAMATLLKLLVKTSLSEDFYLSTGKLKTKIVKYLGEIVDTEDFCFEVTAEDFALDSIAKAVNIHIVGDEDDFVELLTDYMSMMIELVGIKLFVFINLRALLSSEELKQLHKSLNNHQIDVLLIENYDHGRLPEAARILIDKDNCEI